MNRKLRLKLALLRHMIQTDDAGQASAEDILYNDCYRVVAPSAGVHEVQGLLVELEQDNRCIRVAGDVVRFSPTARARAFVAENG
jgi:hypothetical protein